MIPRKNLCRRLFHNTKRVQKIYHKNIENLIKKEFPLICIILESLSEKGLLDAKIILYFDHQNVICYNKKNDQINITDFNTLSYNMNHLRKFLVFGENLYNDAFKYFKLLLNNEGFEIREEIRTTINTDKLCDNCNLKEKFQIQFNIFWDHEAVNKLKYKKENKNIKEEKMKKESKENTINDETSFTDDISFKVYQLIKYFCKILLFFILLMILFTFVYNVYESVKKRK